MPKLFSNKGGAWTFAFKIGLLSAFIVPGAMFGETGWRVKVNSGWDYQFANDRSSQENWIETRIVKPPALEIIFGPSSIQYWGESNLRSGSGSFYRMELDYTLPLGESEWFLSLGVSGEVSRWKLRHEFEFWRSWLQHTMIPGMGNTIILPGMEVDDNLPSPPPPGWEVTRVQAMVGQAQYTVKQENRTLGLQVALTRSFGDLNISLMGSVDRMRMRFDPFSFSGGLPSLPYPDGEESSVRVQDVVRVGGGIALSYALTDRWELSIGQQWYWLDSYTHLMIFDTDSSRTTMGPTIKGVTHTRTSLGLGYRF